MARYNITHVRVYLQIVPRFWAHSNSWSSGAVILLGIIVTVFNAVERGKCFVLYGWWLFILLNIRAVLANAGKSHIVPLCLSSSTNICDSSNDSCLVHLNNMVLRAYSCICVNESGQLTSVAFV